jgi:hypothetical protein
MAFDAEMESPEVVLAVTAPLFQCKEVTGDCSKMRAPACSARCARKLVVSGDGARRYKAADLFFRLLLTGERRDADAARVGGVEALDEGAGPFRDFRTGPAAFEECLEAHVSFAAREAGEMVEEIEGVVVRTGRECAVAKASVCSADVFEGCMCLVQDVEKFGRPAVHKFGAELDGCRGVSGMESGDAAAEAVACFEQGDLHSGGCKLVGGGEAGDSRTDDKHVDWPSQSDSSMRTRCYRRAGSCVLHDLSCAGRRARTAPHMRQAAARAFA